MAWVVWKFVTASLFMWALPLFILQAWKDNLVPGFANLSPRAQTLWCGSLAVLSVNLVIVVYIISAMREPPSAGAPKPDPAFVSQARASMVLERDEDEADKTD